MVWLVLALALWPLVALVLGLAIGRAISACESTTAGFLPRSRRLVERGGLTLPPHRTVSRI